EGRHDADDRDERRGWSDPEHLLDVRLETDLEEEERDADLGQERDDLVDRTLARDDPENAGAEHDTGDQLAAYGRLADTFRETPEDLGEDEHRNEHHEEVLDLYTALRGRGRKEEWEEEKGDQPQAPSLHGEILGRDEIGFTLSGGNRAGGPVDRF